MNQINLRVVKVSDGKGGKRFRFRRGAWDVSKKDIESYNHLILDFQTKITEEERRRVILGFSHKKLSLKGGGDITGHLGGLEAGGIQ